MTGEAHATEQFSQAELFRRLGNIEGKLDRLVRLEERQNTHDDSLKRAFDRIEKLEDRVRVLEIADGRADVRTTGNSSAIAIFISALVSVGVAVAVMVVKSHAG